MATLTIELPSQLTQTAFNLRRWAELFADSELAKIEGRIERDRHGHGASSVAISFFGASVAQSLNTSEICPDFPGPD